MIENTVVVQTRRGKQNRLIPVPIGFHGLIKQTGIHITWIVEIPAPATEKDGYPIVHVKYSPYMRLINIGYLHGFGPLVRTGYSFQMLERSAVRPYDDMPGPLAVHQNR